MQSDQQINHVAGVIFRHWIGEAHDFDFLSLEWRESLTENVAFVRCHMPSLKRLDLLICNRRCQRSLSPPVNDFGRFCQNQEAEQDNADHFGDVMNAY